MGVGGVGINAVQGARIAGARHIVALDPVEYKRTRSYEFGATHSAATVDEAFAVVSQLTQGANGRCLRGHHRHRRRGYVAQALCLAGKRGRVVMTATPHLTETTVTMSLADFTLFEKQLRGSLFGSSDPRCDILRMLSLDTSGQLKLDELITREYPLEAINQGYADMHDGINLRGIIRF